MPKDASQGAARAIGRSPERLTLPERMALAGQYVALPIYSPQTLPPRRIEAIGDSLEECVRTVRSRGLNPRDFEFTRLAQPY